MFRQLLPPTGEETTCLIETTGRQRAVDMDLKLLFEFIVYCGLSRGFGVLGSIRQVQGISHNTDHILNLFGLLGIYGLLTDNLCLHRP